MQNRARSSGTVSGAARGSVQQALSNARSVSRTSVALRRAGSLLSSEQPGTPPTGAAPAVAGFGGSSPQAFSASVSSTAGGHDAAISSKSGLVSGGAGEAAPGTPPEENATQSGLTPASLKHLRRQNTKLSEENQRLSAELEGSQVLIKELRDRIAELEELLRESKVREEKLQEELREAGEREERERTRADEAERRNTCLEESLAAKEAEMARLRKALDDQLLLTKEVCEAAERSTGEARAAADSAEEIARLRGKVEHLTRENDELGKEREQREREIAESQQRAAMAMAAAEKVMAMHATHLQRIEQLRVVKLSEAIQHKVELHISVPRVTLSYNNAPPLEVSVASALGENQISEFLNNEVFQHFEPLWVTLDALDQAPDGTSKKAYSTRMLERLTQAVKGFVEKSQRAETETGLTPCIREPITNTVTAAIGGRSDPDHGARSASHPTSTNSSGGDANACARGRPRATGADGCTAGSLGDVDRERLLSLLKSGDDRGLDSKLKELLQSRS